MDYLNRNTTDPTWDKDPRYEGVMGPARAAQQQAQQQAQGDSFIRRAVDKVIVNPTSRWISTVRSVQGLQREADKAEGPRGPGAGVGGTRHAHTDKARAIFDEAGAANERAEQQLNGFLDPLIRDETAGLSAANAGIKLRDLGTYGQALQQRDFDIHDMGSDKWNATVKTDPAMADIDAAANKGDSNALQMRANHMQIMGIEEWQRKLVTNEESTNYKGLGTKDIQDRIEVGEPHHQGAVDKIQQYFRTMLNEAEADGRISQELGDTLRKMYPRYVPVARIMDNIANHDTWGSTQPVGSLTKQGTIRQRGGPSSLGTENLLETVVSRTFQNQREAHRNAVGRELLRVASNYPGWENYVRRVSPEEIKKGTFKPDETNSISFLENGDQVILAVDPIIATAARNLQPRQFGMFVEGGRLLSRVLRTTATGPLNPVFQLSNLAMDALTNVENTGWRTLANAPRTAWAVAKDTAADIVGKKGGKWRDKDLEELKAHGAAFTSAEAYRNRAGSQIDYTVAKSRTGVGPKAAGMAGYVAKHPIDAANRSWSYVEDLFAKSEMASRLRVYVTARDEGLRQGLSQQEAQAKGIDAARNQMANYRHSGSEMAAFNAVTPYFNARLQNLASAWDAGRDDPRRFGMAIMGTIIAPAVAATIYNLSSPEKQRIYFDTPDDVKDDYLFFTGSDEVLNDNGRREVFKWPIPGQYSRLSKAVRMGVESLWRNSPEQFQKLAEEMGFQGMDFTPVVDPKYGTTLDSLWKNVGELGETALPQGTKFITDVVSGVHQYSGRPFVSKGLEGVPTSQQIDKDTGLAITKTAQALGLSPAYVQGVITSLGGQGIPITINAFDQVLQQAGLLPSDAKPGGVSTPESASARFLEGRGGRMKTIDKEGEAGKQEAGYGELMSQMTDGQRELLRQMRLPVKPVTPQEGDTPEVIALRHQLKGRLVGRMIDKVTSAPGWETLSPGDKRIKLQQEALVVSRFLSNRTTESGRLNPRQRMGYWQSQLNAHRR
jgi:hypothetical protein